MAWLMGMVLPAVILCVFLGIMKSGATQSADETTAVTSFQYIASVPRLTVPVLNNDGTVSDMELETYICGVVLAEMPTDFELEALKA